MKLIIISVLLFSIKTVLTDSTYKAAIIEYHPIQHNNSITYKELCKKNVENYINLIKKAPQLDIAVFPEATITTLTAFNHRQVLIDIAVELPKLNKPSIKVNPCLSSLKNDFPEYIKDISCAAKDLKTYIVINTVEKIVCEEDDEREVQKCTEKWNLYNTNVIFDRNGDVIKKYRKFNLFHEPQNCRPKNPEYVTFTTDFGVTFGTFICFDILFEEPGEVLVRKLGVKHFVYPTMWFAEAPFLTALQMQDMWASGNNVTLLAANANDPKVGSGGSGIYQGLKGPRSFTIESNGSKLIVDDVYKNLNQANLIRKVDEDVDEIDRKGLERDGFRLIANNLKCNVKN
nr:vanin-like protein 2 [Onthophagus taurus]